MNKDAIRFQKRSMRYRKALADIHTFASNWVKCKPCREPYKPGDGSTLFCDDHAPYFDRLLDDITRLLNEMPDPGKDDDEQDRTT